MYLQITPGWSCDVNKTRRREDSLIIAIFLGLCGIYILSSPVLYSMWKRKLCWTFWCVFYENTPNISRDINWHLISWTPLKYCVSVTVYKFRESKMAAPLESSRDGSRAYVLPVLWRTKKSRGISAWKLEKFYFLVNRYLFMNNFMTPINFVSQLYNFADISYLALIGANYCCLHGNHAQTNNYLCLWNTLSMMKKKLKNFHQVWTK